MKLIASLATGLSEADISLPWPVIIGLLSVVVPGLGWMASRWLCFVAEVNDLRSELLTTKAKLETQHAVLVERISHLPTAEQFSELNRSMHEYIASSKVFSQSVQIVQRRLELFEEWQRDRERKGIIS